MRATGFDVDVVVLWVDGNDPEWLKEKQEYTGYRDTVNRYRDWGLMKYWFRGIYEFLPWIRKIHFVTWGHVPDFLDTDNDKIHIVNHKDYMPNEVLPTYSAQALEMNIHRIEGLSEHFIYFNDDMFVLRPMMKTNFFDEHGFPRMHYEEFPIRIKGHEANIAYQRTMAADIAAINRNFNKRDVSIKNLLWKRTLGLPLRSIVRTLALKVLYPEFYTGFKTFHSVSVLKKGTMEKLWEAETKVMEETTERRFRHPDSVNRSLIDWWQLVTGDFSPRRDDSSVYEITERTIDDICNEIKYQRSEIMCINDPDEEIDFEGYSRRIQDAFETLLPDKCEYEK